MARLIAFYLPQYYPTYENDSWWGKGFTEWTNVGRAKALFRGHYQPRVPADLGYYDLRLPEVRELQAAMAREAGIEGFCYWHYWFAGRRLLKRVFDEVVASRTPDYPFCLCWANHSWKAKTWDPKVPDKMLIEQTYPGKEDYENQFYAMLPAFKDSRYIKVEGKLLYGIFEPASLPNPELFITIWNTLASQNGLPGFYFFGFAQGSGSIRPDNRGLDATVFDALHDAAYIYRTRPWNKIVTKLQPLLHRPVPIPYEFYSETAIEMFNRFPDTIPCIDPNFDHSPRSGSKGIILHDSSPKKWGNLYRKVTSMSDARAGEHLVFIKAWNEWGEGNYLEPDLRFGNGYLEQMRNSNH